MYTCNGVIESFLLRTWPLPQALGPGSKIWHICKVARSHDFYWSEFPQLPDNPSLNHFYLRD